jgi:hypothetical protein
MFAVAFKQVKSPVEEALTTGAVRSSVTVTTALDVQPFAPVAVTE